MKQKVFLNPSYTKMEINEKLIEIPKYSSPYSGIKADIILSGKVKKRKFGHSLAEIEGFKKKRGISLFFIFFSILKEKKYCNMEAI